MFALYAGDETLTDRIERFFLKSPTDTQEVYSRKLEQAKYQYVSYFSQIIQYYTGYLFSHPLNIVAEGDVDLPEYYADLKENADTQGTDLHEILRDAFRDALIGKVSALVAEFPVMPQEIKSLQDWEDSKAGYAKISRFNALNIIDYQRSESGALEFITLRKKTSFRSSPLSDDHQTRETFLVYTAQELQRFVFEYQGSSCPADAKPVLTETIQHGFDSIPVVLLDLGDTALGAKLKGPQSANWHARAKRAILTNSHAHSMPVFHTDIDDLAGAFSASLGIKLGPEDKVDFIRPPSESLDALEEEVKDTAKEIYKVANTIMLDGSGQTHWRSAQSRLIDQDAGNITVRSYGYTVREATEKLLNIIARGRQDDEIIRVQGFEHLNAESFEELLNLKKEVQIPSSTFNTELNKRLISQALPDLDEKKKQIIFQELEAEPDSVEPISAEDTHDLNKESQR